MLIAHRIALDPNNVQTTYLSRAAGTARFAYNWALAEWSRQYEAHKADASLPRPLPKAENQGAVGVDLGVSARATLSTGESIVGPKAHKALLSRLQRLSRSLSRKIKGSSNRRKAKAKLARLHARIAAIRSDALHKLTTALRRFSR